MELMDVVAACEASLCYLSHNSNSFLIVCLLIVPTGLGCKRQL